MFFQKIEELLQEALDIVANTAQGFHGNNKYNNANEILNHYLDLTNVTAGEICSNDKVNIISKPTPQARYKAVQRALAYLKKDITI